MVELPTGSKVKLERLVESGDSVSLNDAIREAVREYTKKRLEQMLKELEDMKKLKNLKTED